MLWRHRVLATMYALGSMPSVTRCNDTRRQQQHAPDLQTMDPHRPVYHITPLEAGLKDPNGLFHDSNGYYHVFHQMYWNHYISRDLVTWQRVDKLSQHVSGRRPYLCSGGATIAPDGVPMLLFCQGATLVPLNASQGPMYRDWTPSLPVKASCLGPVTRAAGDLPAYKNWSNDPAIAHNPFLPLGIPGLWDGSVWKDIETGKYRATFGSCKMVNGTERPNGTKNFCDGTRSGQQDGLPQIVSFESEDLKSRKYLGVPWQAPSPNAYDRPWGPRVECPYVVTGLGAHRNRSILILGAAGSNQNYALVGSFGGSNKSKFTGIGGSAGPAVDSYGRPLPGKGTFGSSIDAVEGLVYASAVMQRWDGKPPLLFSWVRGMCLINTSNISSYNASWSGKDSSALSLPKVISVDGYDRPTFDVAPELKKLRVLPSAVMKDVRLPPGTAHTPSIVALPLPHGATGDAIELSINVACGSSSSSSDLEDNRNSTWNSTLTIALRSNGDASKPRSFGDWEGAIFSFGLGGANHMSLLTRSDPSFRCFDSKLSDHTPLVRAPPVVLDAGGQCRLRVFVDHSIVSVSLNEGLRTLTGRVYPTNPEEAVGVFLGNTGANTVVVDSTEAWGMRSIWGSRQQ